MTPELLFRLEALLREIHATGMSAQEFSELLMDSILRIAGQEGAGSC